MLNVTVRALDALEAALQANRTVDEQVLRIADVNGEMSLRLGAEQPGDQLIDHNDRPVLAVAATMVDRLSGLTLDLDENAPALAVVFRKDQ